MQHTAEAEGDVRDDFRDWVPGVHYLEGSGSPAKRREKKEAGAVRGKERKFTIFPDTVFPSQNCVLQTGNPA